MAIKEISLTKGFVTIVDDVDYDWLMQWKWHHNNRRYATRTKVHITGEPVNIRMHRFIMNCPEDMFVDHINGNGFDNRRENLRICTYHQNTMNRRKNSAASSQYKGVYWNKKEAVWRSSIRINHKLKHLGQFEYELEAALTYNKAALEYFGEFANINII